MRFPITKQNDNIYLIKVDKRIYCEQAINATCYKFTDHCYVHQQIAEDDDNIILVTIEAKESYTLEKTFAKQFCNELVDQQIRVTTEEKFGHIRNLIVEEAFKPVSK